MAERSVTEVLSNGGDHALGLGGQLAGGREDKSLAGTVGPVHALEETNREGSGLAGSGLGLGDQVTSLDERDDRALLDGRRLLESVVGVK